MNPYETPSIFSQSDDASRTATRSRAIRWWKFLLLLSPAGFLVLLAALIAWVTTWEKMPGSLLLSNSEIRTAYRISAGLVAFAFVYASVVVAFFRKYLK